MTPFRNDAENPFDRDAPWPRLPQAPLGFRRLATEAPERPWPRFEPLAYARTDEPHPLDDEPPVWFDSCPDAEVDAEVAASLEAQAPVVLAALRPQMTPPPRRRRRLIPLLGATAVGIGGLLALFLLIGAGPDPSSAQVAPAASASAVQIGR
ncbi:MAG: hypothetical protein JSS35_06550 [Proteobacteria bacterium]|nr:hypothetical protein [Pseudomonadota bacterium]